MNRVSKFGRTFVLLGALPMAVEAIQQLQRAISLKQQGMSQEEIDKALDQQKDRRAAQSV